MYSVIITVMNNLLLFIFNVIMYIVEVIVSILALLVVYLNCNNLVFIIGYTVLGLILLVLGELRLDITYKAIRM